MKSKILVISTILLFSYFTTIYILESAKDPSIYVPGDRPKISVMVKIKKWLSRERQGVRPIYRAHELSRFKQLGTTVKLYFDASENKVYPQNPQDFDFELFLFRARHIQPNHKIYLDPNWTLPTNWKDFNKSNSPYVFVRSVGETFTGDKDKAIFIVRKDYQASPNLYTTVFEDGHMEAVTEDVAVELWKKAGVWLND